jgi:hypothetical protein
MLDEVENNADNENNCDDSVAVARTAAAANDDDGGIESATTAINAASTSSGDVPATVLSPRSARALRASRLPWRTRVLDKLLGAERQGQLAKSLRKPLLMIVMVGCGFMTVGYLLTLMPLMGAGVRCYQWPTFAEADCSLLPSPLPPFFVQEAVRMRVCCSATPHLQCRCAAVCVCVVDGDGVAVVRIVRLWLSAARTHVLLYYLRFAEMAHRLHH